MENTVTLLLSDYEKLKESREILEKLKSWDNILYSIFSMYWNTTEVISFKKFNTDKIEELEGKLDWYEELVREQSYKIEELKKELEKEKSKKKSCILF